MTCAEVLETLSTASLRDMPADSAVMAHCATCPDCARVTTLLREKEYEAASVLNGLPPMSNPLTLAEAISCDLQTAQSGSHRGIWYWRSACGYDMDRCLADDFPGADSR